MKNPLKYFAVSAFASVALVSCAPQTIDLFNGKDLTGWSFAVDGEVPSSDVYSVVDGQIRISGQPFGYMYTDAVYSDYDLEVEWAWEGKGTNSGVFLNIGNTTCPFPECIECNLQAGNAGTFVLLGGAMAKEYVLLEDGILPKFPVIKHVADISEKADGEWNVTRIEMRSGHIKVYINDVFQNECTDLRTDGHIGLQSEGGPIRFKTVRLTKVK